MELDAIKAHMIAGLEAAKQVRSSRPYSNDNSVPIITIFPPEGQVKIIGLVYNSNTERAAMRKLVQEEARSRNAEAIMLASDSRWTNTNLIRKAFPHMPDIKECGLEAWKAAYYKLLAVFDGQLRNMPRDAWEEAVTVAMKGPNIAPIILMAKYVEGPSDTIEYLPSEARDGDSEHTGGEFEMIPNWW